MSGIEEPSVRSPLERVLVATDFSVGAAQALGRAQLLPLAADARISVAHVVAGTVPVKLRALVEAGARRQLEEWTWTKWRQTAGSADRISTALSFGKPHVEVLRQARVAAAELLVLGRHGERPFKDLFIGSTADRILRTSEIPVLVVSHQAVRPYRRPVFAVDLAVTSLSVVRAGLRLLDPAIRSATLLHAYHVAFEAFVSPGVRGQEMTFYRKENRDRAVAAMAHLEARLSGARPRWRHKIVLGDPLNAILDEAQRSHADLLVLGTHGRGALSSGLLGSVAQWTIGSAPCDVLVSRPTADGATVGRRRA